MGLGPSNNANNRNQGRPIPGAPKAFYLVMGNPPIQYLRNPQRGPLIFQVDLPQDAGPEQVERAQTVKNYFNITHKQGMKLKPVNPHDVTVGFELEFVIDGTKDCECQVDVFVGVKLELRKGTGLVLLPDCSETGAGSHNGKRVSVNAAEEEMSEQGGPDGKRRSASGKRASVSSQGKYQYQICNTHYSETDGGGLDFTCEEPILLQHLKNPVIPDRIPVTDPATGPAQPSAEHPATMYSPIVIRLSYDTPEITDIETGEIVQASRKQIFTTCLKFDPTKYKDAHGEEGKIIPCGSRSFLEYNGEVFEMNDIFDTGDGAVQAPSEKKPGDGGGDESEEAAGGVGGSPAPAGIDEDEDEANTCVVCLTNRKDTTVLPCRHLCLCSECAGVIKHHSGKCPVCRGPIEKLMAR